MHMLKKNKKNKIIISDINVGEYVLYCDSYYLNYVMKNNLKMPPLVVGIPDQKDFNKNSKNVLKKIKGGND